MKADSKATTEKDYFLEVKYETYFRYKSSAKEMKKFMKKIY